VASVYKNKHSVCNSKKQLEVAFCYHAV
jgi:hypothetical protein